MARRKRLTSYTARPAVKPTAELPDPSEGAIFGTKEQVKQIIILAVVLGVLSGLVFFVLYHQEQPKAVIPGTVGSVILGGVFGMFVGLLVFVYPCQSVGVPMMAMLFFALATWVGAFMLPVEWKFTYQNYLALVGLLFVSSFIGFWLGYWMYTKKTKERSRFQARQRGRLTSDENLPE